MHIYYVNKCCYSSDCGLSRGRAFAHARVDNTCCTICACALLFKVRSAIERIHDSIIIVLGFTCEVNYNNNYCYIRDQQRTPYRRLTGHDLNPDRARP